MLTINVAPDGSGQFTTISEAVLAVPYDCPAVIRIAPGIYREKLVCERKGYHPCGRGHGCHPAGMERWRQAAAPGRASHPHLPQLYRLFSAAKSCGWRI